MSLVFHSLAAPIDSRAISPTGRVWSIWPFFVLLGTMGLPAGTNDRTRVSMSLFDPSNSLV